MSFINDALKKTQQNLNQPNSPQDNSTNSPHSGQDVTKLYENLHHKQSKSSSTSEQRIGPSLKGKWVKTLLIVVCLLGITAMSLFSLLSYFVGKSSAMKPAFKPVQLLKSVMPKKSQPRVNSPAPRVYKEGTLFVNGVMQIEGRTVALINDELYEVGDAVNGKKIVAIHLDGVELLDGDQNIFLSVQ